MPAAASRILDTRSLATSHRRLAERLRPGMTVLDVGCGTGAITRDICARAGAGTAVVGADISATMLAQATAARGDGGTPWYVRADVYALPFTRAFDIVTVARVLQWVSRPDAAVRELMTAVRPGGILLALEYDHVRITWTPTPPASMQQFHAAFLRWRADAGMDNAIAGRLATLFESAGVADVRVTVQHERTVRGDTDFVARIGIWADVAATRGHQMVADGAIGESDRAAAEREYRDWIHSVAESQTMFLLAVEGTVSGGPR
jgi:ubiquinone/menaquinone biosynthesis C-methylase UbiE